MCVFVCVSVCVFVYPHDKSTKSKPEPLNLIRDLRWPVRMLSEDDYKLLIVPECRFNLFYSMRVYSASGTLS